MPTRSNPYLSGSPYPTGIAPLELNLDDKVFALTQQMVKSRKDEIKQNRLLVDSNEEAILNALDFEPLEGAGDKIALQHAESVKSMEDKWAKVFKDRQGMLTSQDKIDLLKDKRGVEQNLKKAAADIAQIAEIKKGIGKGIYDDLQTSANLTEYQKAGLIGSGGALNIPVLKKQPFGAEFEALIDPFLKQRSQDVDTMVESIDTDTGQESKRMSNKRSLSEAAAFIQSMPEYQELYKKDPAQATSLLNRKLMQYSTDKGVQDYVGSLRDKKGSGQEEGKLTSAQQSAIDNFLLTTGGIAANDARYTNSLVGMKTPNGVVQSVERGDNTVTFKFQPKLINGLPTEVQPITIDLPDPNDEESQRIFNEKLWSMYPPDLKKGLTNVPISGYLTKGKKGAVQYKPAPKPEEKELTNALTSLSKEKTPQNAKALYETLIKQYPDLPIKLEKGILGKVKGFNFKKKDSDGYKRYYFEDEGRIDELVKDIQEYIQPRTYKLKGIDKTFTIPYNEAKQFEIENRALIENG